jgi:hypothetical protein
MSTSKNHVSAVTTYAATPSGQASRDQIASRTVPSALGWAGDELHYLRPQMRPGQA